MTIWKDLKAYAEEKKDQFPKDRDGMTPLTFSNGKFVGTKKRFEFVRRESGMVVRIWIVTEDLFGDGARPYLNYT
jgi:hypothetical protein